MITCLSVVCNRKQYGPDVFIAYDSKRRLAIVDTEADDKVLARYVPRESGGELTGNALEVKTPRQAG